MGRLDVLFVKVSLDVFQLCRIRMIPQLKSISIIHTLGIAIYSVQCNIYSEQIFCITEQLTIYYAPDLHRRGCLSVRLSACLFVACLDLLENRNV